MQGNISRAASPSIKEGLLLLEELLRHIPHTALMQRPELTSEIQAASAAQRPYVFACTFYGAKPIPTIPAQKGSYSIPFASAFENIIRLSTSCAQSLLKKGSPSRLREVFTQALLLIDRLVGRLGSSIEVLWNPTEWLSVVLKSLDHEVRFLHTNKYAVDLFIK